MVVMIREAGVVREPRGISWQNWAATCKDTLVANSKYFVVALLVVTAAVGGTLYAKHAATSSLAHKGSPPAAIHKQINLNTQPATLPTATDQTVTTQTTSLSAGTKSSTSSGAQTKPTTPVCNVAAQTAANLQYTTNLTLENTYHTTQLTLLGVTGTVGSLLGNPNATKINAENTRHQNVLNSLQATLTSQLTTANCIR